MLKSGMPINIFDYYGFTALMSAAFSRNDSLVRVLLEKGANVNQQHHLSGKTALHFAVAVPLKNNIVIKKLVQHGARTDIRDNRGITPIDLAPPYHEKARDLMLQHAGEHLLRIH